MDEIESGKGRYIATGTTPKLSHPESPGLLLVQIQSAIELEIGVFAAIWIEDVAEGIREDMA